MTQALVDLESSDSADKDVVTDSLTPQNHRDVVPIGRSTSRKAVSASLGPSYDHNSGHPTQDRSTDGKVTKQWPKTPQKSASSSKKYAVCRHLPLTPAQTPSRGTKRAYPSDSGTSGYDPTTPRSKRSSNQPMQSPPKSPFRTESIPKFSIHYNQKAAKVTKISALELKRASESILSQVDWDEVQESVASNRCGSTFRKAIKAILQERVDELFEEESCCPRVEYKS